MASDFKVDGEYAKQPRLRLEASFGRISKLTIGHVFVLRIA
jgi:hypothetical protein